MRTREQLENELHALESALNRELNNATSPGMRRQRRIRLQIAVLRWVAGEADQPPSERYLPRRRAGFADQFPDSTNA